VIVALVLAVLVGGVLVWRHEMGRRELEGVHRAEVSSVGAIKHTFADVAKVEFRETRYHRVTGTYFIAVTMTSTSGESVEFDYGYFPSDPLAVSSYGIVNRSVQKRGSTSSPVEVVFSNGQKDVL
jgi:poly-gamma-glutamate capsule biosynthesis protein CapA/YwtB (metallophosphatase superfamily)